MFVHGREEGEETHCDPERDLVVAVLGELHAVRDVAQGAHD